MTNSVNLASIFNMESMLHILRPEQEKRRIAVLLGKNIDDLRVENRVVIPAGAGKYRVLMTVSIKPIFLKWLFLGRDYYQVKFSSSRQLVAIVKLKTRSIKCL